MCDWLKRERLCARPDGQLGQAQPLKKEVLKGRGEQKQRAHPRKGGKSYGERANPTNRNKKEGPTESHPSGRGK